MSRFLPGQFLNNREICSNQSSIYRRTELKYRTKVKCDDFKLWLKQIGIFVLYVKLVVSTVFAQAQTDTRL